MNAKYLYYSFQPLSKQQAKQKLEHSHSAFLLQTSYPMSCGYQQPTNQGLSETSDTLLQAHMIEHVICKMNKTISFIDFMGPRNKRSSLMVILFDTKKSDPSCQHNSCLWSLHTTCFFRTFVCSKSLVLKFLQSLCVVQVR